ncbi:hypothetical protein GCM10010340_08150 [Streptomyces griseoloalbus]|nr:hypothetical protein GCM10010340_08150 [Streptomyces albaduncus]
MFTVFASPPPVGGPAREDAGGVGGGPWGCGAADRVTFPEFVTVCGPSTLAPTGTLVAPAPAPAPGQGQGPRPPGESIDSVSEAAAPPSASCCPPPTAPEHPLPTLRRRGGLAPGGQVMGERVSAVPAFTVGR